MSLHQLGLCEEIIKALQEKGYKKATKIQEELIPAIFSGRDVIAGAQTGTGKTAGYALPLLERLGGMEKSAHPKVVVLVPTRELARQVANSFDAYAKYLPVRSCVLYGGTNLQAQAKRLQAGAEVIVATSGRLLEHIKQKNIVLSHVEHLILDEADTILDMGFVKEVMEVANQLPTKRQNILISATLSSSVKRLADALLHRPVLVEVARMGSFAEGITQVIHPVEKVQKTELLSYLIGAKNYKKVLVFVRKKILVDEIVAYLNSYGLKSEGIHGEKTSGARQRAMDGFKEGKIRVLVATDIAARGLDIPDLNVVINYDIPHVTGDFIHRIGRTGRAGSEGLAITLLSPQEESALYDVERLMNKKIPREKIEGYDVSSPESKKSGQKKSTESKKVDGAFGKRQKKSASSPTKKKRKVTKRDGFKQLDRQNARKK